MDEDGTLYENKRHHILFAGLFVILIIVAAGAFIYFKYGNLIDGINFFGKVAEQFQEAPLENLSGYMYFNGSHVTEKTRAIPYVYSFASQSIQPIAGDGESYVYNIVPVSGFSRNTTTIESSQGIAFLRAPFEPNDDWPVPYTEFLELVYVAQDGVESTVDSRDVGVARGLVWSESAQAFAYHGLSKQATASQKDIDYLPIENWSVYLVNSNGSGKQEIEEGVSPVWSSDGRFVYYLGTKGIYRYDTAVENIEEVLTDDDFNLPSGASLTLTHDETALVHGSPSAKGFFVYELSADGGDVIDISFYKSVNDRLPFAVDAAPDGPYVTFVTFARIDGTQESSLSVLDTTSGAQYELFTLPFTEINHGFEPTWSEAMFFVDSSNSTY